MQIDEKIDAIVSRIKQKVQAPNVSDDSLLNALSAIADIARMVIEKGGEIGKCLRQSYYDAFAGELRELSDRIEKDRYDEVVDILQPLVTLADAYGHSEPSELLAEIEDELELEEIEGEAEEISSIPDEEEPEETGSFYD